MQRPRKGFFLIGTDYKEQWFVTFLLSAGIVAFCLVFYIVFVDVNVQPWDPEFDKAATTVPSEKPTAQDAVAAALLESDDELLW